MSSDTRRDTLVSVGIGGGLASYIAVLTFLVHLSGRGTLDVLLHMFLFMVCSVLGAYMIVFNWDLSKGWGTYVPVGFLVMLSLPVFLVVQMCTSDMLMVCLLPSVVFIICFYVAVKIIRDDAMTDYRSGAPERAMKRAAARVVKDRKKAVKKRRKEEKIKDREKKQAEKENAEKKKKEGEKKKEEEEEEGMGKDGKVAKKEGGRKRRGLSAWLSEGEKKDGGGDVKPGPSQVGKGVAPKKGTLSRFSDWLNEEDKK